MAAEKIHGSRPNEKTIGLVFSPEEGIRLAISMLAAAYSGKRFDVTIYRKARKKDGKFKVTVTAA